jgi:hypothetical protein
MMNSREAEVFEDDETIRRAQQAKLPRHMYDTRSAREALRRFADLSNGPSRDGPAWVSAVWNDALDAAARVADEQWCMENSLIGSRLSRKIADAIRDLKHSNATQREGAADVD